MLERNEVKVSRCVLRGGNWSNPISLLDTVRGLPMEKEQITSIVQNILSLDVNDGIQFRFHRIEPIREDDAYNNFRIHLDALYGKINSP